MKHSIHIMLFLFLLCPLLSAGTTVKIFDNAGCSSRGFIVKENGKFYVYTAQSSLFGIKKLQISGSRGVIKTGGDYQVSFNSDLARIPVNGEFADFLTIGNKCNLKDKVNYISSETQSKSESQISGIGVRIFTIDKDFPKQNAGFPVLNSEGQVIGILSSWKSSIVVSSEAPGLLYKQTNHKIASRMDKKIKWVSAAKTNFEAYGAILKESQTLQKEFLPIIQWWYEDPYRTVPENFDYSKKMKSWVKYNNRINKIVDKLVAKIAENPQKHKNLIKSLQDSTMHRTKLLYAFPSSQHQQLQTKWSNDFLKKEAVMHTKSWKHILKVFDIRKQNLEFVMPHQISKLQEELYADE